MAVDSENCDPMNLYRWPEDAHNFSIFDGFQIGHLNEHPFFVFCRHAVFIAKPASLTWATDSSSQVAQMVMMMGRTPTVWSTTPKQCLALDG